MKVTPLVGVWIEIDELKSLQKRLLSLPLWECGLKYRMSLGSGIRSVSLPLWECGLKYV